jgi:hypothetical protein
MVNKKIIKLCRIIGRDLALIYKGDTASALWPFTTNEAEYFLGEFFIQEIYSTIKELKNKGYTDEYIARLFYRPSKISQYFAFFHSAKILGIEEREKLALWFLNFINYYRKDPFCLNRTNILRKKVFDPNIIALDLNRDEETLKNADKITSYLLLYLELIYPTMMRLGQEFHGPYKHKEKIIFVKEFYNLKSFSRFFPFQNVTIIEELEEFPKVDFFNHLLFKPESKAVAIMVDGKRLNKAKIELALRAIEKSMGKINALCSNLTKKDWLKVLAKGLFLSFENLRKECGRKFSLRTIFEKIDKENFEIDIQKIKRFIDSHSTKELEKIVYKSFLKIFAIP